MALYEIEWVAQFIVWTREEELRGEIAEGRGKTLCLPDFRRGNPLWLPLHR